MMMFKVVFKVVLLVALLEKFNENFAFENVLKSNSDILFICVTWYNSNTEKYLMVLHF